MKKRLAVLAGGLALCAAAVALTLTTHRLGATALPHVAKQGEAPKIAASRIVHVTVYPDSALVTREVEVPAGGGLQELVISPLPQATITSSLYTESADGFRVMTTRFRTRAVKEDTREEVRKLDEEIRKLQLEQRRLQSEAKAIEGNSALLAKLENFTTASTLHATEKGKLDSQAAIDLAKYLMEGRLEKAKLLVALQEKQMQASEQLDYLQRQMRDLTSGTSKVERDAVVVVEKANAAAGKVRLNYLVSTASWRPQYKFRAGKTAKDPVQVEYLAAVMQQTGEDWERVDLTLSTAQPMLNATPPELHALAVNVVPRGAAQPGVTVGALNSALGLNPAPGGMPQAQAPARVPGAGGRFAVANPAMSNTRDELAKAAQVLRQKAQETWNEKKDRDANELANYAAVLEQACDLTMNLDKNRDGRATPRNEGPSVTYHLTSRFSVPSRHDDQVIEVAKIDLTPEYYYKAVPVITPHVYRQANLMNKSKFVLLPGEATMYHGNDFVGRMALPLVAIGEQFTAGFGAEPQLQVTRQLLDRTRTMQAGNQVLTYNYRILVSSYKDEKVRLQVWDRLPRGENESLGVNLIKAAPALCKDAVYEREERANNLLRWDVDVDPEMKGEKALKIEYEFRLELDKQATLGSFLTK
jgi:hypothetical protein